MMFRRLVQTNEVWVSDEVDGSVLLLAPVEVVSFRALEKTRAR